MSFAFSLGRLNVLSGSPVPVREACSCKEAQKGCAPSFVFSVEGQIQFREALHHLTHCRKQSCRSLRTQVFGGMQRKLRWLMSEEELLGCVRAQPLLYGKSKIVLQRRDFPALAHHLAHCPRESCAQLRRSLLLKIRDEMHE